LVQFHEAILPFLVPSVKLLNPKIKVIKHDHGEFVPFFESAQKSVAVFLKRLAYRFLLVPCVDKIVCVSQHVLDDNRRMLVPGKKLLLIYNATKVDVLKQIEARRQANREKILVELKIPQRNFVVATAARMVGWKRLDYLLRAFATLSLPNKSLILMGEGPKCGELKALAEKLGIGQQAHFLGYRKDAKDILSGMDAVVLPSQGEAFGLTALESVIMHVPVFVMRDGYGLTEFVKDGENGFICRDLRDLSQKLDQFAQKKSVLQEDPGYAELLERSRAEHYINEFKKLYREMLNNTVGQ
jgi:glycosyltransferase involved in cell wall biosynthesis